jgi:hypothetical protein
LRILDFGQDDATTVKTYELLIRYWQGEGLRGGGGGVSSEALLAFETKNGVTLPSDFREYFANVNGRAQAGDARLRSKRVFFLAN